MFEFMKPLRAGAIGVGAVAVALGASMSAIAQSSPAAAAAAEVSEAPPPTRRSSSRTATPASCAHATPEEAQALHAGRGRMPALAGAALRRSRARTGAALTAPASPTSS